MWRSFVFKVSLLVVMVLLCVGVPIVNAEGVLSNWTSPTTRHLRSVFMVNASDGWAVGDAGTIIRWDGDDWRTVTSPTGHGLLSVFMISADDGWAVGWDGTIIQWTGTEWIIPEFPTAILVPLFISLTLVVVILAKTTSKKLRKPTIPSKTQL